MGFCHYCLHCGLISTGIVFVLIGVSLLAFIPKAIKLAVQNEDYLGFDSDGEYNAAIKKFILPPYKVTMEVWTFSVLNAQNVTEGIEKPRLVEKGPYTFTIKMEKDIAFGEKNATIFYRQNKVFFFDQSLSCPNCKLNDRVVVPNILFQKLVDFSLTSVYKSFSWVIESIIEMFNESAFIEVSVDDLLFHGYQDPMISAICNHRVTRSVCKKENIPERIGLFYQQNNTNDGLYEVDTGKYDRELRKLARVYSFNEMKGQLSTNYWYGPEARMINGTNGEVFPTNLLKNESIEMFIGQLCRSLKFDFNKVSVAQDIATYHYTLTESISDVDLQKHIGFCNPDAPLYFTNSTIQQSGCTPAGVFDMSTCLPGNPRVYMSQPHFKNSPNELNQMFQGMAPASDSDISYYDIEPISGVPVEIHQKQQLNLGMLRGNMKRYMNFEPLIAPIIWLNTSAIIDSDTRGLISIVTSLLSGCFLFGLGLTIVSAILFLSSFGICVRKMVVNKRRSDEARTSLINAEHEPAVDLPPSDEIPQIQ